MTPEKGKYVSRSTYQKVVEENKRLTEALKILTTEPMKSPRWQLTFGSWFNHFRKQEQFNASLSEILAYGREKCLGKHNNSPKKDV